MNGRAENGGAQRNTNGESSFEHLEIEDGQVHTWTSSRPFRRTWWRSAAAWVSGQPHATATEPHFESMEYIPANSAVYRDWLQWQPHSRAWDKWLVMALIGMSVGTTSFLLQQAIETLFALRSHLGRFFLNQQAVWGYLLAWFFYVALSAGAALVAAILVVKISPAASASGVPQIMAFLNGVRVPKLLNVWTFIVKFWSCSLVVAAGLPVGPEGPLIHMGAILGSAMSGLHSTTMGFDMGIFRHLRGSKHKRDFVTAGVAAGVAAAFDAPLGGLLFAFEEVASFWHSHLGWQVFFCCTVAVLVQNLLRSLDKQLHNEGHFGFFNGNVTFKVGVEVYAHVLTIVPAAILGLFCGAFAIAFSKLNLAIAEWRARVVKPRDVNRLLEVLAVTLVYTGVCMLLPHLSECSRTDCTVPRNDPDAQPVCPRSLVHSNGTLITTNEDLALTPDIFNCPLVVNPSNEDEYMVHYNPMATLINPLGEDTISRLFARGVPQEFRYKTLWILLGWYFIGAAWAAGMDISSGMFVPMLLIGAVLGRLMGLVMVDLFQVDSSSDWYTPAADAQWKWVDPGVFAVVGAAGFMGGVTRLTIALAAIMMEVSSDVQMLLPVLVAILVAKGFADKLEPHSYYHAVMDSNRMPFLAANPHTRIDLDLLTVRAAMAAPVQTVPRLARVADIESMLRETGHNGFPVVQPAVEGLVCVGLVTRHVLLIVLQAAVRAGTTSGLHITYPDLNKHIDEPLNTPRRRRRRGLLDTSGPLEPQCSLPVQVPASLLDQVLDISRYINRSAHMVHEDFSLARAYSLFTSVGLRHLIVIDEANRAVGIITRKDLTPDKLDSARAYVDSAR